MLLEVDSVRRSHRRGGERVGVLDGASLEIGPGDLVAVYGRRNAGKTTLLRIAAGFEQPDSGEVRLEDVCLTGLSQPTLARLHREDVAWVERAGPHSRELPVHTYVALPLFGAMSPVAARQRAMAALKRVGVGDHAECLWEELSDAGRTLVAIAQALVREPKVLIVDDPTAGLGIVERERVVGLLRSAAEDDGVGVLMAVPDMPSMLQAHQVRVLTRGRLVGAARDSDAGTVIDFPTSRRSL